MNIFGDEIFFVTSIPPPPKVARSADFSRQFWVRGFVEDPYGYCSCEYERLAYLSILKT